MAGTLGRSDVRPHEQHGEVRRVGVAAGPDLVDELRTAIYPLTLGSGKRLFPQDSHLHFELDEVITTPTGVILASYRRAEAPAVVDFDYESMVEPTSEV